MPVCYSFTSFQVIKIDILYKVQITQYIVLIGINEAGTIPFIEVGTHRRIRFIDLMEYKKRRDEERERGLAEITRISEELGLYD